MFRNNANLSETAEKKHNQNYFMEVMSVDGVYDCMMFMGKPDEKKMRLFLF